MNNLEELRDLERSFKEESIPKSNYSLWELIRTIHSNPISREKVGVEAIPLMPYISALEDDFIYILSLLAVPLEAKDKDLENRYNVQSCIIWRTNKSIDLKTAEVVNIVKTSTDLIQIDGLKISSYTDKLLIQDIEDNYRLNKSNINLPNDLLHLYESVINNRSLDLGSVNSIKNQREKIYNLFPLLKDHITSDNMLLTEEWRQYIKLM